MSLVVFPFKEERADVVVANMRTASLHPRIQHVLAVAERRATTFHAVEAAIPAIRRESNTCISLIVQDRLGTQRSGKGDAMNTGLKFLESETLLRRVHFYDADITNFSGEWITKAEVAADRGFDVVRHNYPRARCDAMITWMITRVGLALLWPRSTLAQLNQPLGGEVLLSRDVAKRMLNDARVIRQSDWGIDTALSVAFARHGLNVYEVYMPLGKQHKLYDSLADLRTMLCECFATIQALQHEYIDSGGSHDAEASQLAPRPITERIGFDVELTLNRLMQNWTPVQDNYLRTHLPLVSRDMMTNRRRPSFSFMDEATWGQLYASLLASFVPRDAEWEELLFKLWAARVLAYTTTVALRGYEHSRRYLEQTIDLYRRTNAAVL